MLRQLSTTDGVLDAAVESDDVPGVVGIAADGHGVVYEHAAGVRDTATGAPMTVDTSFRIASQTKLATAIAAMQLVEQGAVALETPVGDVLPAFDELQVLEGFDGDAPRLRPPASRATLRQLLSHSSGLGYDIWNHELTRYVAVTGTPRLQSGLRAAMAMPLVCDPGADFNYGTSMDWAGLVVEALSGMPLERYWETRIFAPLAMRETTPVPSDDLRDRMAPVHARDAQAAWVPTPIDFTRDPEMYAGGHCLYSTPRDYLTLQRLMLGGGALGDVRLLQAETVAEMLRDHLSPLDVGTIVSAEPLASEDATLSGMRWGLGLLYDPIGVEGGRSPGSSGWMGGFNTFFWIDRDRGLTAALYTQTIPFYDARVMALVERFERALYSELAATTTS